MDWDRIKAEFEFDGSWRDIYVLGTTWRDWAAVWLALRSLDPTPKFFRVGHSEPMPAQLDWATAFTGDRPYLAANVGRIEFNCHFFVDTEIEFDFDPRSIEEPSHVEDVARFMALLGRATGKPAILTGENCRATPIASFDPISAELVWLPAPRAP